MIEITTSSCTNILLALDILITFISAHFRDLKNMNTYEHMSIVEVLFEGLPDKAWLVWCHNSTIYGLTALEDQKHVK